MAARKRRVSVSTNDVELARLPLAQDDDRAQPGDLYPVVAAPTVAEIRAERELDDILLEIGGGDIKVKVLRFADSGAMQSCGEMSGDTFSMESLTDTFGGGRYLLRFMRGRLEVDKTRVEVDPLIPPRNPRAPKGVATVQPAQGAADMMTMMTAMTTMMMNSMQIAQQGTSAMVAGMAEMMKARPAERDPMDIALRLTEVMKQPAGAGGSAAELFSVFEKGMNVAAKMNGGGDGDEVLPLVSEGVKGVVAIMEGIGAEKKANALASEARMRAEASAPVAVVAPPPPAPVSQPELTMGVVRPWVAAALPFKEQLGAVVGFLSPSFAASALMEKLTDDALDDLVNDIEDATAPGFVHRAFAVLRPGVLPTAEQAEWVSLLAAAVLESVEDDGPGEPLAPLTVPGNDMIARHVRETTEDDNQ